MLFYFRRLLMLFSLIAFTALRYYYAIDDVGCCHIKIRHFDSYATPYAVADAFA